MADLLSKSFAFGDAPPEAQGTNLQEKCQTLENQLENLTSEKEYLARTVSAQQAEVLELKTQIEIDGNQMAKLKDTLTEQEAKLRGEIKELKEQNAVLTERLKVAPVIDEAILSLYVEVRMLLQQKLQGPPLSKEEKETLPRTAALVVLEKLRTWVRKILLRPIPNHLMRGAAAALMGGGRSSAASNPSPLQQTGTVASEFNSTSVSMMVGSFRGGGPGSPSATMPPGGDSEAALVAEIGRLQNENDELSDQVDSLREELQTVRQEAATAQQHSRTIADLARRDAANTKQECKKKEARIEQLQQELQHTKQQAELHTQCVKAHNATESTKKDLRNLLDAKKQEIALMRRQQEEDIREITSRLNHLERQKTNASLLNHELQEEREKLQSVKNQIVRANIPALIKEKNRANDLANKQQERILELETKLQGQHGIMQHLEQTNKKMTEQYNMIFEAHVKQREIDAQKREKVRGAAISKAVTGPDCELNAKHYRERYYEVLEELKQAQGKMKQLLLFAQHDHLAYAKHTAQTEQDLAEVEVERDALHVRTSNLVNALHAMQSSHHSDNGMHTAMEISLAEEEKILGEKEDASVTFVTPSVRIEPDRTTVDVSIPSIGESRTPYGGPLDESEILRVRTEVPTHEPSIRALTELQTSAPPVGTKQNVLNRRPQKEKRTPGVGSTRGKKFDFASVGRARFNTNAIASLVRPKSATPDLSFTSRDRLEQTRAVTSFQRKQQQQQMQQQIGDQQ